jgi:hypothetical protein
MFERLLEDYKKLLYPTAEGGQKKVGYHTGIATMEGKEWCIRQGIGELLTIAKKMLPKVNELSATTYVAK